MGNKFTNTLLTGSIWRKRENDPCCDNGNGEGPSIGKVIADDLSEYDAPLPNSTLIVQGAGGASTSIVDNILTITQGPFTLYGRILHEPTFTTQIAPFGTQPINYVTLIGAVSNFNVLTPTVSVADYEGFQCYIILKDNGVSRNITWDPGYTGLIAPLPSTTVAGKVMTLFFIYNIVVGKWTLVNYQIQT